jgi:hypothetical protein
MLRLSRTMMFCVVLALPSLTVAQTIFDLSGTIEGTKGYTFSVQASTRRESSSFLTLRLRGSTFISSTITPR